MVKEVADAPALPPPPKPKPKPVVAPKPVLKPEPLPPDPQPQAVPPPQQEPATSGEQQQANAAVMQARLSYGDKFSGEVSKHRPRHATGHGNARVAFEVNAAGDVTQAHIATSSGDDTLDEIALTMVRDSQAGPPPDGHYSGTIPIRFNLR